MGNAAPGCFGIPSIFNLKSDFCSKCIHFAECRHEVWLELNDAPQTEAVIGALTEHERFAGNTGIPVRVVASQFGNKPRPSRATQLNFALTLTQKKLIQSLPKNVGTELATLYRRGADVLIRRALVFNDDAIYKSNRICTVKMAVKMLRYGFSKAELVNAFMKEFGWSKQSARVKAHVTWMLLKALKVAVEINNCLMVDPNLFDQNNNSQH